VTAGRALTLDPSEAWRLVGRAPEGAPVEFVLRSFDRSVLFGTGAGAAGPDGEPVVVLPGTGARLTGLHFFARPAQGEGPARILVRGT
jgi:hypothetical protein